MHIYEIIISFTFLHPYFLTQKNEYKGGPIFRLKGSILCMSFLDCNGALIPYSYEPWRDEGKQRDSEYHFYPFK